MKTITRPLVAALAVLCASGAPIPAGAAPAARPPVPSPTAWPVGSDGMARATVVLAAQQLPAAAPAATRRQHREAIGRALRQHADATQRDLLDLLARRRAQHLVTSVDRLWIFNGIDVTAAPSVLREIAARPDVRAVLPEMSIPAPRPNVAAPPAVPALPAPASGPRTGPPRTTERPTPGRGPVRHTKPRRTNLSGTGTTPVESNIGQINAPAVWSAGHTGQGVVVASMDTGVDVTHPDLASSWRGGTNSWYDPNGEHPGSPVDVSGHGTQTMGVIVGGNAGGTSIGVAPDASWIAVKIFNDRGMATSTAVHRGFQWLLDPDGNPATDDAPDVVNDSWTLSAAGCSLDFQLDLRGLRAAGIVPVFSAGNYGPTAGTVLSPANDPEALAVGAVDDTDTVDQSSSRGPSACGSTPTPQLTAPGVAVRTTDLYGGYVDASGTSLAAPHVAGALALLLSAYPKVSADRQVAALTATAADRGTPGPDNDYGYGRIDAFAAYQWLGSSPDLDVTVSPASASLVAGGTVIYSVRVSGANGFTSDVTLGLTGLAGTQGSWSVEPPVIAGGSGTATLTVSTAASLPAGSLPLTVTATGGGISRGQPITLVVTAPPDFTLAATPTSRTLAAGAAGPFTVTVTGVNGFTSAVSFALSGLPVAVGTASFAPASVIGTARSTLTVSTLPGAAAGTYPLTVTASGGGRTHTVGLTLVVVRPDFTLSAAPSSVSVSRTRTAYYTVSTAMVNGFTGHVSLTVSGSPTGSTASFSANPIATPGSSTLSVRTTTSTPRGTFTLRITGTSGGLVHMMTVTLVVT